MYTWVFMSQWPERVATAVKFWKTEWCKNCKEIVVYTNEPRREFFDALAVTGKPVYVLDQTLLRSAVYQAYSGPELTSICEPATSTEWGAKFGIVLKMQGPTLYTDDDVVWFDDPEKFGAGFCWGSAMSFDDPTDTDGYMMLQILNDAFGLDLDEFSYRRCKTDAAIWMLPYKPVNFAQQLKAVYSHPIQKYRFETCGTTGRYRRVQRVFTALMGTYTGYKPVRHGVCTKYYAGFYHHSKGPPPIEKLKNVHALHYSVAQNRKEEVRQWVEEHSSLISTVLLSRKKRPDPING